MKRVKFGDIVREVKIQVDRNNNPYPHYVAGDHMDSMDLTIRRKGCFATDDVGPAFIRIFKPGQVLYGSRRTYLKKIAVADFEGICSNTTFVLETKDSNVFLQELLPFVMLSDSFTKWSISHSKGSTNPYVLFSDLANYEFTLPSLDEQKVLADKLWAAYRVKESYKKLLAAIDDMLKAKFMEMFGGLEKNGTIKDIIDTNILSVKKSYSKDSLIEYIDISSIDSTLHNVNGTTTYIVDNAPSRAQQCVQNGDILVSTVRPINRNIAVVNNTENNLVASTGFCVLRPISGYEKYILTIVVSDEFTQSMCDKASGGVYPAVVNSDVLNYPIVLPDKNSLQKISAIATQAEATKESLRKSIENIDQVIKSLINQ